MLAVFAESMRSVGSSQRMFRWPKLIWSPRARLQNSTGFWVPSIRVWERPIWIVVLGARVGVSIQPPWVDSTACPAGAPQRGQVD